MRALRVVIVELDFVDLRFHLGATERSTKHHELNMNRRRDATLQDQLEGEMTLQHVRGVAFVVVDPGFQDPLLTKSVEATRLVVELGYEVVCTVWSQLQICVVILDKLGISRNKGIHAISSGFVYLCGFFFINNKTSMRVCWGIYIQ